MQDVQELLIKASDAYAGLEDALKGLDFSLWGDACLEQVGSVVLKYSQMWIVVSELERAKLFGANHVLIDRVLAQFLVLEEVCRHDIQRLFETHSGKAPTLH
jgi:hypothetical protein